MYVSDAHVKRFINLTGFSSFFLSFFHPPPPLSLPDALSSRRGEPGRPCHPPPGTTGFNSYVTISRFARSSRASHNAPRLISRRTDAWQEILLNFGDPSGLRGLFLAGFRKTLVVPGRVLFRAMRFKTSSIWKITLVPSRICPF